MGNLNTVEDIGAATTTLLDVVREISAQLHPRQLAPRAATLDTLLGTDLGFDSLGRAELLLRIERIFDVTLPEQVFIDAETPRDLLRAVLTASSSAISVGAAKLTGIAARDVEAAPGRAQTLVEVLDWHASVHPEQPHIQFCHDQGQGEILTYRQLKEQAEAVASGLQQRDLRPGETVVLMLATGRDYFFGFFGVLLAGGIPVPIYPPVRRSQLEDHLRRQASILRNCLAPMLIVEPDFQRAAQLVKSQVHTLHRILTVRELCSGSGRYEKVVPKAQDVALLQYTSGSTGNPKGVIVTHANLLANIRADGQALRATPGDVFVSWLPLYHDMGLIGAWLGSLYFGPLLVIMSPVAFLTRPQRWLWAIHRLGGTLSAAPNFAYELCLHRIDDQDLEGLDLSTWRVAINGAETVSPETVEGFCRRFKRYGFRAEAMLPLYGLAECSLGLAFPPLNRGPLVDRIQRDAFMRTGRAIPIDESETSALRFVACGQPLPEHQIRIVGPGGRELPERHEGHLQFAGPSATSGYYRNPQETEQLFQDEWLNAGDLAYVAEGEVYITGRSKDIIIRAGRNIYPYELEEAVGAIPDIRKGRVAIFGSPDPASGTERLVIVTETRVQDAAAREILRRQIDSLTMELLAIPADKVILAPPDTVLKTSSGKIRRAATRELYEQGRIGKSRRAVWWQILRLEFAGLIPRLRRLKESMFTWLYAAYVWSLFGLLGVPVWLLVIVLPSPAWRWRIVRFATRVFTRASGTRLSVTGLEHLPSNRRQFILVANHASYIDSFVLAASLPIEFSFVAKAELKDQFFAGVLLSRLQCEFVERFDKKKGVEDARWIANVTHSGRRLMFFPEGTFTRTPGLLPFHLGAFVAAVEASVPILPVAIRGTRSILRSDSWFPRRGSVTITIGEAVGMQHKHVCAPSDRWDVAVGLRDAAREHILRFCGEPDLANQQSLTSVNS